MLQDRIGATEEIADDQSSEPSSSVDSDFSHGTETQTPGEESTAPDSVFEVLNVVRILLSSAAAAIARDVGSDTSSGVYEDPTHRFRSRFPLPVAWVHVEDSKAAGDDDDDDDDGEEEHEKEEYDNDVDIVGEVYGSEKEGEGDDED